MSIVDTTGFRVPLYGVRIQPTAKVHDTIHQDHIYPTGTIMLLEASGLPDSFYITVQPPRSSPPIPPNYQGTYTKTWKVQRCHEQIGMLLCRPYMDFLKLPVSNTAPMAVMTDINVLTVRS